VPRVEQTAVSSEYAGNVTWRWFLRATTPLGKLRVHATGIWIGPSRDWLEPFWRLFRLPILQLGWGDIEVIEPCRLPFGHRISGILFKVEGKTLTFGSTDAPTILDEIERFAPDQVIRRGPPRVFF
jgi:hypothetical protein